MRLPRIWQISAISATAMVAFGCGKSQNGATQAKNAATPVLSISGAASSKATAINLDQSFSEAVIEDSPQGQQPPTDITMSGKSTASLRLQVQRIWNSIRLRNEAGQVITYIAKIDTDYGMIRVQLLSEAAPNHVRNFVALAKCGYYDGLVFEQVIKIEGDEGPDSGLELIEGGCPLGTGEQGVGHLGYWLKPEINEQVLHEPGTMGACHEDSSDTAACRFYLTISKAPALNGSHTAFGRVVAGMDVIRTISKQSRDGNGQPVKPAGIRAVTVETQEAK